MPGILHKAWEGIGRLFHGLFNAISNLLTPKDDRPEWQKQQEEEKTQQAAQGTADREDGNGKGRNRGEAEQGKDAREKPQTLYEWAYRNTMGNRSETNVRDEMSAPEGELDESIRKVMAGATIDCKNFSRETMEKLAEYVNSPDYSMSQKEIIIRAAELRPEWGAEMAADPRLSTGRQNLVLQAIQTGADRKTIEKYGINDPGIDNRTLERNLRDFKKEWERIQPDYMFGEKNAPFRTLTISPRGMIEEMKSLDRDIARFEKHGIKTDELNLTQIRDMQSNIQCINRYRSIAAEHEKLRGKSFDEIKNGYEAILTGSEYTMAQREALCMAKAAGADEYTMALLTQKDYIGGTCRCKVPEEKTAMAVDAIMAGANTEQIQALLKIDESNRDELLHTIDKIAQELDSPHFVTDRECARIDGYLADKDYLNDRMGKKMDTDKLNMSQIQNVSQILEDFSRYGIKLSRDDMLTIADSAYSTEQETAVAKVIEDSRSNPQNPFPEEFMDAIEHPGLTKAQIECAENLFEASERVNGNAFDDAYREVLKRPGLNDAKTMEIYDRINGEMEQAMQSQVPPLDERGESTRDDGLESREEENADTEHGHDMAEKETEAELE